jgi:hypothetical protein
MEKLGFPQFAVTPLEVSQQTGMPAQCPDCHLGNSLVMDKEKAHEGLLSLRAVTKKWTAVARKDMPAQDLADWPSLERRGKNRATQLGPKRVDGGELKDNPDYRTIIWHDKNPETLAFNPVLAEKTCGKCHPKHVQGFLQTSMGGAKGVHTQSQYVYWTSAAGPQSCGPWLGVMTRPEQDKFTDENIALYNGHSTTAMPQKVGHNMQRNCNTCHVGCLDCHYDPQPKTASPRMGVHTFARKPRPETCYGGGRSFACHAGPLERRRGDGYLRAEYTQATDAGKKALRDRPDVHAQKGIACVDCHEMNAETGFHADLRRDVNCGKCHAKAAADHRKGVHKNVDCSACHTALIGGYAFNFWTVTGEGDQRNPATRIQDYLVDAIPPLIVRNPKGVWVPVHAEPHTSGNVKADEVALSKKLMFRNRPDAAVDRRYFSNDSYAITGLAKDLDAEDRDTLVWFHVDRVAHSLGRSRTCDSCHAPAAQKIATGFSAGSYKDVEDGGYTIIADAKGLRVTDFKGPDSGPPAKGLEPLKDKWMLKGNFELPKLKDQKRYDRMRREFESGRFAH